MSEKAKDGQTALPLRELEVLGHALGRSQAQASDEKELPFSGEFSPGQVELHWLLEAVELSRGSRSTLAESIRARYFSDSAPGYEGERRLEQQRKRAGNVIIGLKSYGVLMEDEIALSPLGQALRNAQAPNEMHDVLARHILLHLHGSAVLGAIETLDSRREQITKTSLARELESMGFIMPQATTKHTTLLNWLRKANVLPGYGYKVDMDRVGELLGASPSVLTDLDALSQDERYFLRALGRIETRAGEWLSVSQVVNFAQTLYSVDFPADQWQAKLLRPLEQKGWIELQRGTGGRGAKSGNVRGTEKFESEYVRALLEEDAPRIPPELRTELRKPLEQILRDLESDDRNVKGRALELLAMRIAQFLDLQYRSYRLRSVESAYAEVDLIVEGTRLLFTRWQIQCKNTSQVRLDDLAKEVGLAIMLKSHVVVMVTTGQFGSAVRAHANVVNQTTALQVVLLDGQLLRKLAQAGPGRAAPLLTAELNEQARRALTQKAGQVEGIA